MRDLAERRRCERRVEDAWQIWKTKVITAADRGIGKMEITERSREWWSTNVEAAIQAWRVTCKELRARKSRAQVGTVQKLWERYRNRGKFVK